MTEYTVKFGQNIFDIALSLYGSIEGVLDLFVCNPNLSFDSDLKSGDKLLYTETYIEDSTVLEYYKVNKIVPSNQIGGIYFKSQQQLKMMLYTNKDLKIIQLSVSGIGNMQIDWGDNSNIESVTLSSENQTINHIVDNNSFSERLIKIYGEWKIYNFDLSGAVPVKLFILSPIYIERMVINGALDLNNIEFVNLMDSENVVEFDLVKSMIIDMSPLIKLKQARIINVSYSNIRKSVIDSYLIGLVQNYGIRRNCTVSLIGSIQPSGIYQKPKELTHPTSGMEAIWVLVNEHKEPTGPWKFILNNKTYTA